MPGDRTYLHELLDATLRIQENGLPPDLWEALLDEASFAIRHYFMALPALRELGGSWAQMGCKEKRTIRTGEGSVKPEQPNESFCLHYK